MLQSQYPLTEVRSKIDNKVYKVRDLPDKQAAADLLARIRIKMGNFMTILETKFQDKPQIQRLVRNFRANPERLLEATPEADHTSYSVNKGEKVHLCLRQREGSNEQLVDDNVMMFVALHEMSHVGTSSIGHTPEFWNHFAWMLQQAEATDIYKYTNFAAHPVEYCGVHITDSPKYKETVDDGLSG
jgi:hypothetical protein